MRVVSLVPSLTETLFALGLRLEEIVGRTPWCVCPRPEVDQVPVVGGTKTPSVRRVRELAPDLVILDCEENRRETHEELEALGLTTWVSRVTAVSDVPSMLEDLGRAVGCGKRGLELSAELRGALEGAARQAATRSPGPRVLPLIWHDPLMAISPRRYGGDLLVQAGFRVPDPDPEESYPRLSPTRVGELEVDFLLLSSEPHPFTLAEGESLAAAVARAGFPAPRCLPVDGQALTWFGFRTTAALQWWLELRARLGAMPPRAPIG